MTTPAPNLDQLSQDDLEGMDMGALEALARGGAESPLVPEAPQPEPMEVPEPAAMATPEAPSAPEAPPMPMPEAARQGDPEVPLRALREQLREAQEREAQIDAFLRNPQAVIEYARSIAPEEAPSFDEDPDAALEARVAPLLQKIEALERRDQQRAAQMAHNEYMGSLAAKHGPDFHHLLQAFDDANPHFSHIDPELRYVAALGLKHKSGPAIDPAADEARIQAAAQKMLAEKLATGQPMRGIPTLGAAPQARESGPAPDLDRMGQDEQDRMSFAELQALAKKAYGGG